MDADLKNKYVKLDQRQQAAHSPRLDIPERPQAPQSIPEHVRALGKRNSPCKECVYTLTAKKFSMLPNEYKSQSKAKRKRHLAKLKSVTQIVQEILDQPANVTVRIPGLTGTLRYKLRKRLPGYFMDSRGQDPNRCMYVWRAEDVASLLRKVILPDVVDAVIMPALHARVREEWMRMRQIKADMLTAFDWCDTSGSEDWW
jgi:hypothetical protein